MLNLPARIYSKAVWETVRYRTKTMFRHTAYLDTDTFPATVSAYTEEMLERCSHLFRPAMVAEVGTYVGRSTAAIANGSPVCRIHTCDTGENLFDDKWECAARVHLYPRTTSTEMFSQLRTPVDFFFFDGRIHHEDIEHIKRLSHDNTVYLFDDFEGIEKGVCNALMLQNAGIGGILVYPEEGQTLGMIIRKIGLTRQ